VVDNRHWGREEEEPPLFEKLGQQQLQAIEHASYRFFPWFLRSHLLPTWVFWSLATNGIFVLVILVSLWRQAGSPAPTPLSRPAAAALPVNAEQTRRVYQQSVGAIKDDARLIAVQKPKHLAVMAGDSISLWFPQSQLTGYRLLNQGISGETSAGLLKRLYLFDQTKPEVIFVMIGINDLLRGKSDAELLENQQQVIEYLKWAHPKAQIVMQSVLPHAVDEVTWEGRDRLLSIPNSRIKALNQKIEAIAQDQSIHYLNLYPLLANAQGNLRRELSSDGLHLSSKGYEVWGIALQVYGEAVLQQKVGKVQNSR
jgi:lysophospholipase L1-like esterase